MAPAQRVAIAEGLQDGEAQVRARTFALGHTVHGWSINQRGPRFEPGALPPVDTTRSITLYYAKDFLVSNAMGRGAIGDRTPCLVRSADGGLEIRIQHVPPKGNPVANWLPAPPEPFMLLLRLHHPQAAIREGRWLPPAIERIGT